MKTPTLASGRSARWAFMEKFEVPDYDDPPPGQIVVPRLIQTPWLALYLHRMDGPDPRPTLHDHPWSFVSVILRGGYVERRLDTNKLEVHGRTVRFLNLMPTHGAHSIRRLLRTPTWTFLIVGPRRRMWGYLERDGDGPSWTWTPFNVHRHAEEFDAALSARRKFRS